MLLFRGVARDHQPGHFFRLENRQHAGLSCDHEPGADAAVAACLAVFFRLPALTASAGWSQRLLGAAMRLNPLSYAVGGVRRLLAPRPNIRSLGAGADDELAGDVVVRGCGVQPGGVDQPAADQWRFAMNRKGFVVSFAAFLVSGAIFAGVGYRVMTIWRAERGAVGHGSESVVDPSIKSCRLTARRSG